MKLSEVVAYHGSMHHPAFSLEHNGMNSSAFGGDYSTKRFGTFFTDNINFAKLYGTPKKYFLKISSTLDLDTERARDILYRLTLILDDKGLVDESNELSNIIEGYKSMWPAFEQQLGKWTVSYLVHSGYDSATFVEDHVINTKSINSNTTVVFNPSNIVKDAQFELDLYKDQFYEF